MSGVACIPARFGSTRLPGKRPVDGEPMIAHVVPCGARGSINRVLVGTDHAGVAAAARASAEAVMTDPALPSARPRRRRARVVGASAEIVVNVQGDEPRVAPSAIDAVVGVMRAAPRADVGTLSAPLPAGALLDASRVKVVCRRDDGDGDGIGARSSARRLAPTARRWARCWAAAAVPTTRLRRPCAGCTSGSTPSAPPRSAASWRCRRRRSSAPSASSSCARSRRGWRSPSARSTATRRASTRRATCCGRSRP